MATKIRIGNIGGAISEPAIDKNSWQYLRLKYGEKTAAKKLGVGLETFKQVVRNQKKNLSAAQVAKIERNYKKLPRDVKRRAAVASDLFKEATQKQKLVYMKEMTSTRKGMSNLNKMLDEREKDPNYEPFDRSRFGSPKAKRVSRSIRKRS